MNNPTSTKPQSGGRMNEGHSSLADVRSDFGAVRQDISKLGSDAVDYASGAAAGAAQMVSDKARHGADVALDAAKRAGEYGNEAYDQVCDFIRERPMTSALIAVGIGAVLARILIPRR